MKESRNESTEADYKDSRNILSIDCSTHNCSVALMHDEQIKEISRTRVKSHHKLILPIIDRLLSESSLSPKNLDLILCGLGPGSFVGQRIALGVAQGLSFANNIKLVGISSLAALAYMSYEKFIHKGKKGKSTIISSINSIKDEVYLAAYEASSPYDNKMLGTKIENAGDELEQNTTTKIKSYRGNIHFKEIIPPFLYKLSAHSSAHSTEEQQTKENSKYSNMSSDISKGRSFGLPELSFALSRAQEGRDEVTIIGNQEDSLRTTIESLKFTCNNLIADQLPQAEYLLKALLVCPSKQSIQKDRLSPLYMYSGVRS